MKNIEKINRIYIFCYADYASGGPEALHQLRYYMETQGIDAWIVYVNKRTNETHIIDRYLKYFPNQKKYIGEYDYKEATDHLIIMPENMSFKLFLYKRAHVAIWWLGVYAYDGIKVGLDDYHYDGSIGKNICKIRYRAENIKRSLKSKYLFSTKNVTHYCGSKFAYDYVTKEKKQKAFMLVEPIGKDFLDAGVIYTTNNTNERQSNVILYNPSRPSKIMESLIKRKKFQFFPIKGYTPEQLISIYRRHKIYIDFGGFPGPERIPKEAVYNGCNILVGKQNAAVNDFDVAIPDKYKLKNPSVDLVESMIENMLNNYEEEFQDFNGFRKKINGLERDFVNSINILFQKY